MRRNPLFIRSAVKKTALKSLFTLLLKILVPRRCMQCRTLLQEHGYVCAACWSQLTFIAAPLCACCGIPLELSSDENPAELLCGACCQELPPYHQARAALLYDEFSKPFILGFKHGDALHPLPSMAEWMGQAGRELLARSDLLIPVPLHWRRLVKRRYNQAALLAQKVSTLSGIKVEPTLLIRTKNTPSQGHLTGEQRRQNVKSVFKVKAGKQALLNQKVITLIDDVYTSGATVNACAKVLLKAGAKEVNILTLARVARL